ncbi:cadherin domain-containing protein [Microvirga sp. CF3016]|uniref:cadherin domain-containing protein n=1 Tax=Microvirga sp. CF3016 TaxID=3110181 RepID=UPI002E78649C|nr:cadherin domain-containing protein [Microvirga sp. CF3016]MEE1610426.1 cadherin domain-containing protein [Microvirga sp. CF3016]
MAIDLRYTIEDQRTGTQNFTPTSEANVYVLVKESGSVTASDRGILIVNSSRYTEVTVNGSVSSTGSEAVSISSGKMIVGATGRVSGDTGFYYAMSATVENHRSIIGSIDAIEGSGALTVVNMNNGIIHGDRFGIHHNYIQDYHFGPLNITNEGTISGGFHAIASAMSDDIVINKDTLTSNGPMTVDLGGGKDLYDSSQGGKASGSIELGQGNDTALGGTADDYFRGGEGEDLLVAGGGFNLLLGGAGRDTLDGSDGTSIASYENASSGLTVHMAHKDQNTGDAAGDHFINIAGILGSPFNDTIMGNDDGNDLRGGYGADSILGGEGADSLTGGRGDDTLLGGQGNDTLVGGGDGFNDSHFNAAVYTKGKSNYTITRDQSGVIFVEDKTGAEGKDTLKHIKTLKFADGTVGTNTAPDSITISNTSVAENTLVNTIVADLSAHDADGDAVTFRISDYHGYFNIDGNHLILIKALDYETQRRQHTITIEAVDAFGGITSKKVTINITDVNDTAGDPGGPTQPTGPSNPTEPANPLVLIGTPKRDSLSGRDGNDVIKGLANKDTLHGNGGNDMLYGGLGNDVLTGGAGQDVFVFDKKLSKTNALNKKQNSDKITDFSVIDDTIWLSKGAFKGLTKKGVLAKKEFHIGAKAHDGNDHVIYNKKTGALSYDADGKGGKEAIQIATLSRDLKLTETDFFVL